MPSFNPHCFLTALILAAALPGIAAPPVIPGLTGEMEESFAGQVLLGELNCAACHPGSAVAGKGAPVLDHAATRIRRDYLEAFIAAPGKVLPGTTMPDVLGKLPDAERRETAAAIADYLQSLSGRPAAGSSLPAPEAVERGRELYHAIGCVACHSPENELLPGSPPLHRLEDKYSLAGLTTFLEDPLAVRPGGRMPDMQLSHWEAVDLASYLLRDQAAADMPPDDATEPSPAAVDKGRQLFSRYGCVQCHQPTEARPDFASPLPQLDASRPCTTAHFALSETQQTRIQAAHSALGTPATAETAIRLTLTRLNCIACHSRDGFGGAPAERDAFFTTTNLNLGDQARIPPPLTGVGAKLKPAWLRKVLVSGESARPYMNTRMPIFGAGNVEPLLDMLAAADTLPTAPFIPVPDEKKAREAGFELVGSKNLACVACHTFNGESATTLEGMELTSMTTRLQENWFHHYLRDPQKFHPTTIMPSFWPGGKATRPEILEGDTGQQIDAIWQYLADGREARMPHGIRREPIAFGPSDGEAVMLRRQYQGIGKRGIGVGYPAGINLSFDAGQMRVGSIWKGDFAEMSGVWRGQGAGNVGEQGREIVRFPPGPGLALLDSDAQAWPELGQGERASSLQFKGYTLDARQRPTFRYAFRDLLITDGFVDNGSDGEPSLTRTVTFSQNAPEGLCIRVAADKELVPGSASDTFRLPRGLEIRLDAPPVFRTAGELRELLLPVGGKRSATIIYQFSSP